MAQAWVQQWNRARRPPRRMKTAFAMYIRTNYHTVRSRIGTRKPQIIYRACAQLWRNTDDADRQKYINMETERRRYYQERDVWSRRFPGRVPRIRRRRKPENAPKRPRNPFILYRMDHWPELRESNPTLSQQEITRLAAGTWRTLPKEKKQHYREKADEDRERYAIEMSQFRHQQAEVDAERRFQNFEARLEGLRIRDQYRRTRQQIERNLVEEQRLHEREQNR